MAIELNNRTKVLAGVVVLAGAGAAAWFLFLEDFLSEPPPKPAASAPAKPAAPAPAAKADAPKAGAATTESVKPAPAGAAAAKPSAKPIPANPDQLIAEVIEASGIRAQYQAIAREVILNPGSGGESPTAADVRAITESIDRVFEPGKMTAELAANLKKDLDLERMGRFLELLRQPIALKMTAEELRKASPEASKEFSDNLRKNSPPPARAKLIQSLDDVTRTSQVAVEMSGAIARGKVDAMLAGLQKAGKSVPKESRQMVGAQLTAMRNQAPVQIRAALHLINRNATDQDLTEYLKLLDTDTGRWGSEVLANAMRPILTGRGTELGAEVGKLALSSRAGVIAKAPAPTPAPEPLPKAELPAEVPAAAAGPVGYQRPAGIKELYTRYNDLLSATVMRDRAAVKELLDDRKFPDVRQKDGTTPLMIAVANGDADIAGMLLAKGADPNLRAVGGTSALSLAKARGAAGAELVQLLQRSGAKD